MSYSTVRQAPWTGLGAQVAHLRRRLLRSTWRHRTMTAKSTVPAGSSAAADFGSKRGCCRYPCYRSPRNGLRVPLRAKVVTRIPVPLRKAASGGTCSEVKANTSGSFFVRYRSSAGSTSAFQPQIGPSTRDGKATSMSYIGSCSIDDTSLVGKMKCVSSIRKGGIQRMSARSKTTGMTPCSEPSASSTRRLSIPLSNLAPAPTSGRSSRRKRSLYSLLQTTSTTSVPCHLCRHPTRPSAGGT